MQNSAVQSINVRVNPELNIYVNQIDHPALITVKDAEIGFLLNQTTLI
jgi:hypothetical protein